MQAQEEESDVGQPGHPGQPAYRRNAQDERWDARLEELREFKKEHGHCDVPVKHPGGLGTWIQYQRKRNEMEEPRHLDPFRIQKLEDVGFRWKGVRERAREGMAAFMGLSGENGTDGEPGEREEGAKGAGAGGDEKAGRPLSKARDGTWKYRGPNEKSWNARLEQLREFRREHGHCNVPVKHPGGLGSWAQYVRKNQREGPRRLEPYHIRQLDDEGFIWEGGGHGALWKPGARTDPGHSKRWTTRVEELREFRREHGHCNVPGRRPGGLGKWVEYMRRNRKERKLDPFCIGQLDALGFNWLGTPRHVRETAIASSGLGENGIDVKNEIDDVDIEGKGTARVGGMGGTGGVKGAERSPSEEGGAVRVTPREKSEESEALCEEDGEPGRVTRGDSCSEPREDPAGEPMEETTVERKAPCDEARELERITETHKRRMKRKLSEVVSAHSAQFVDDLMKTYGEGLDCACAEYEGQVRSLREELGQVRSLREEVSSLRLELRQVKDLQDELRSLREDLSRARGGAVESQMVTLKKLDEQREESV